MLSENSAEEKESGQSINQRAGAHVVNRIVVVISSANPEPNAADEPNPNKSLLCYFFIEEKKKHS